MFKEKVCIELYWHFTVHGKNKEILLIPAKIEFWDVKCCAGQQRYLECTLIYNQLGEAKCSILSDGVSLFIRYTIISESFTWSLPEMEGMTG